MNLHKRILPGEAVTRLVIAELIGQSFACTPLPDDQYEIQVKAEFEPHLRKIIQNVTTHNCDVVFATIRPADDKKILIQYGHTEMRQLVPSADSAGRNIARELKRYYGAA